MRIKINQVPGGDRRGRKKTISEPESRVNDPNEWCLLGPPDQEVGVARSNADDQTILASLHINTNKKHTWKFSDESYETLV